MYTRGNVRELAKVALELLEYKVADVREGRPVIGGAESAWSLQRRLVGLANDLAPEERRKLDQLSHDLGLREEGAASDAPTESEGDAVVGLESLVLGGDGREASDVPPQEELTDPGALLVFDDGADEAADDRASPPEREERATLQRLALRVWRREVERFAEGMAAAWRAERDRTSARLLHATLRNLERYRHEDGFSADVNLRGFRVTDPIPERVDPLLSLSDVDSLASLARDVVDAVLDLKDRSPVPSVDRRESLDYVRRVALAVARDPYAGRITPVEERGPSASDLRAALRDLGRERLPEWQRSARRREIEARLAERQDLERQRRGLFQRDVLRFTELMQTFFDRLARLLPLSYGGHAEEPQLPGGALFAVSPALRRERVPQEASSVTLRLVGPARFTFLGFDTSVGRDGPVWVLHVGNQEVPLQGFDEVEVGDLAIEAFLEGGYLHLRQRDVGRSLATRTAEAAVVLHVLASPERDTWISTLRLLANGSSADPKDVVQAAVRRCSDITSRAPDRRSAIERLIAGAARAVGATLSEASVLAMVQRVHLALTARVEQLDETLYLLVDRDPEAAPAQVLAFSGEPLDVDVAGRKITVRRYGGRGDDHLVAMLPGHVLGSFHDHLIETLTGGTLVCVHGDQEIAVAYLPGTSIERPTNA